MVWGLSENSAQNSSDPVAGKFELYTDKTGKFRFRLKAGNGEIVAFRRPA